jgi:hypothetical protein
MVESLRVVLLLFAVCAAQNALAQDEPLDWRIEHIAGLKPEEVKSFLKDLQNNAVKGDSERVCSMMAFPLRTSEGNIDNANICKSRYNRLFNKKVLNAIAAQKYENLFARDQGVMIGNGEIWISGVCKDKDCKKYDLKVVTVNNEFQIP